MATFGEAIEQITTTAQAHPMVARVLFEFDSEIPDQISKLKTFPVVLIKPIGDNDVNYQNESGTKQFNFEIEVLDRLEKGRENLAKVLSDCERILNFVIASMVNGSAPRFAYTEQTTTVRFVNSSRLDYLAGAKAGIALVTVGESPCKITEL